MNRFDFLGAQEWLEVADIPPNVPSANHPTMPARRPAFTAFAGAASLHISPSEQYEHVEQYAGQSRLWTPGRWLSKQQGRALI
jgi:hypothetical protein